MPMATTNSYFSAFFRFAIIFVLSSTIVICFAAEDLIVDSPTGNQPGSDTSSSATIQLNEDSGRRFAELKYADKFEVGKSDFTIVLRADADGELLSKYDPATRKGFHFGIITRQGVTHSQANVRQLTFGLDDGSTPRPWVDHGRLGNAIYVHALAVHNGNFYAGTCEPGKDEAGHVYRWEGGTNWFDCGSPHPCNAVISLAEFQGKLYAGVGKYRVAGSSLPESDNQTLGGKVFRYEEDRNWKEVGSFDGVEAVGGLLVTEDRLYASSLYKPAGFFRMEREGVWTALPLPDSDKRVESMTTYRGEIFATSYDNGHVYRFDKHHWLDTGPVGDNTQTYGFAIQGDQLYVSTWPSGKVFRYDGDAKWTDVGRLGQELEVMGMASYNGQLYAGTLPLAEVYRYDGGITWTSTGRVDLTPDVKYRRAWSMAVFNGRLFCGTLPSGHVQSLSVGQCITFDRTLPKGPHDLAAVRQGNELRLYVDGKEVARSESEADSPIDVSNAAPLFIGKGPTGIAEGSITHVRIYRRALSVDEIQKQSR